MGDMAPTQSRLCVVLCTTLWALLWIGAPVWNPSVGIKCEGPLVGSVDLGVESHVELRCGFPVCGSSGGSNEGFHCGELRLRELQWGAPVGDSSVGLGLQCKAAHYRDPLWGPRVGLSCMCTSSKLHCELYCGFYCRARLYCGALLRNVDFLQCPSEEMPM